MITETYETIVPKELKPIIICNCKSLPLYLRSINIIEIILAPAPWAALGKWTNK